jgi:quinoprotein relay system zinc metallohydrolase 1
LADETISSIDGSVDGLDRRALLKIAGVAGALAYFPMFSAAAAPLRYTLLPVEIAPGAWMLAGANEAITQENGGAIANITILDTLEGAIIIDTGPSRRYGMQLDALARSLTGKPVARVLLTHFHPDHVFGCQAFKEAALAAPAGVVEGLRRSGEDFASAMYYLAGDWMRGTEVVLPGTMVETGHEDIGERRLRYLVLSGHTECDLAIFDELSGLLVAGDLAFLDRAPTTPHAELHAWRRSLAQLSEIPFARLVPGHGPSERTPRALQQTGQWLQMLDETLLEAFDRGLAMTEAMQVSLPKWTEGIALARYEFGRSVMHIYPKLEANLWPRIDKSN